MLVLIARFLSGYLRICIEGYSPERFLNLCSYHGIYLWNLRPCGHAYEMNISVKSFRRLKPIIRKTGTKVIIRERRGVPFFLHKYRKRKLFFCGLFFCIACIYVMSLFIWNIHIDGNKARTDEVLLEFLDSRKIHHGMLKSRVDCDRIVKDIRKEYNDIIWVSAYIRGTRLMINVKENTDRVMDDIKAAETALPMDIVAEKDGVILQIITRKGVPLVHVGDEVKKGDILVSGTVEVLNDAGEVTEYQYQKADADIIARTEMVYEDLLPLEYRLKHMTGKKRFSLWFETENHIYCFGKFKVPFKAYTVEIIRQCPKLGEHFWMPFSFGLETVREYQPETITYSEKEYREILSSSFHRFCQELEKKGVQISENNVKIYKEKEQAAARGTLILSEPFGEEQEGKLIYGNSGNSD